MTIEQLEKLHKSGKAQLPVDRINHREYVVGNTRYFVGWSSEGTTKWSDEYGYNTRDVVGWIVYKTEPETK